MRPPDDSNELRDSHFLRTRGPKNSILQVLTPDMLTEKCDNVKYFI